MEEKKYPTAEEEEFGGKVCEGMTEVHDWIDDMDWDKFPSFGPFSDEEAKSRIEEAEADLKDPSKWITAEGMDRRLYERFPWLR